MGPHKEVKPVILDQIKKDSVYRKEFRKLGDNPDIGIDSHRNIVFKSAKNSNSNSNSKTLPTNWSFESFLP